MKRTIFFKIVCKLIEIYLFVRMMCLTKNSLTEKYDIYMAEIMIISAGLLKRWSERSRVLSKITDAGMLHNNFGIVSQTFKECD